MDSVPRVMVDSKELVASFVEAIKKLPRNTPTLFVDLEGIRLSRYGSVSLVVIYVNSENRVYLVDVHALGSAAFTTASPSGATLKSILEDPGIVKVFFDVRNDSDALHHHFGVRLRGVEDVQLMENACRPPGQRRFLNGLDKCINQHAPGSWAEKNAWKATKEKGLALFHPSKGGSYEVFNARPIDADIERYCVNDVTLLPQLRSKYWRALGKVWKEKVGEETLKRVEESQSPSYQPQSELKKFGPWEQPIPDNATDW